MAKKLPKLRSRLVAPPRTDPSPAAATTSTTDSTGTDKPASTDTVGEKAPQEQLQDGPPKSDQPASSKEEEGIAGQAEANEKFVSEVSAVIGKIASFYGSGLDSGSTSGDANNDDKGGGPPSGDIMITSPPEVSSEQVAVTTTTTTATATPPTPPPPTTSSLPSYAPENCATVVDSNYQPTREPSTSTPAKSEDEVPAILDTIPPPLVVDALPDPSEAEVSADVAALESMLVTEKEIFGDSGKMSDDSDNDIQDDGDDGDGIAMETGILNAEELAWIEAEFKKITAVPALPSTTTTATAGETSSASDKIADTLDKKPQVYCHVHVT